MLVVAGVGWWQVFGGGGELDTAADRAAGCWCSSWLWLGGGMVAVVAVQSVTAADGAAGRTCSSWLWRRGGMAVAAAVAVFTAAEWAACGRCFSWLGRRGGKVFAAGGSRSWPLTGRRAVGAVRGWGGEVAGSWPCCSWPEPPTDLVVGCLCGVLNYLSLSPHRKSVPCLYTGMAAVCDAPMYNVRNGGLWGARFLGHLGAFPAKYRGREQAKANAGIVGRAPVFQNLYRYVGRLWLREM